MSVAQRVLDLFPDNPTVAVVAYDDSRAGPDPAAATLEIRSPRAFQRVVTRPGELGFARAYVAGDIVIDGDIYAALEAAIGQPDAELDLLEFLRLAWHEAGPSMFSSRRLLHPRRPTCGAAATACSATRRPSPTTTTSPTASTSSSWAGP